jgi:hypothetical protein
MNKEYIAFIEDLKKSIVRSRYIAAKLANQEPLLLYLRVGMGLSEKVVAHKWGSGIVQKLADDLQVELPGLKGFSFSKLKNMRQFYEAYYQTSIWPPLAAKIQSILISQPVAGQMNRTKEAIVPPLAAQLQQDENQNLMLFFGISFTHHLAILNGCNSKEERWYYISKASAYNDDITQIVPGLIHHQTDELERHFSGVSSTEFFWKVGKENLHEFELEELKEEQAPMLTDTYACRYVHRFSMIPTERFNILMELYGPMIQNCILKESVKK